MRYARRMHAFHEQIARAFVPFVVAIAVGAALRADEVRSAAVDGGRCRVFVGAVSGNDPDARVRLTLCRGEAESGAVRGQLVWNGRSGTSVRDVEGALGADGRLHLVDARIALDAPNPGWMFCPVDEYALVWDPRGDTLSGSYVSAACDDHAALWLQAAR